YSTALCGKNCLNSPYNCAASVLLGASTRVGRCTACTTFAIVKVLPEPVTPSSVCAARPASNPSISFAIACGWSPEGRYGATSSKRSLSCCEARLASMPTLYVCPADGPCQQCLTHFSASGRYRQPGRLRRLSPSHGGNGHGSIRTHRTRVHLDRTDDRAGDCRHPRDDRCTGDGQPARTHAGLRHRKRNGRRPAR